MSATTETKATSNARSGSKGRKPVAKSTPTRNTAQGSAGEAVKPAKVDLETLLKFAPTAKDAADLAKRAGVPDDVTFRRALTHHSQGKRVLSQFKNKLIREDDPKLYREPRPARKAPEQKTGAVLIGAVKVAEVEHHEVTA